MRIIFLVFTLALSPIALAWGIDSLNENNGIVALPNFPHGVVLCGEGVFIDPEYEDDPRARELLALAEDVCPQ